MERKTLDLLHKARDAANRMEKEEAARLMGEAELHRIVADYQSLYEINCDNRKLRNPFLETRQQVLSCICPLYEDIAALSRDVRKAVDAAIESGEIKNPDRFVAMLPELRMQMAQAEGNMKMRYERLIKTIEYLDALNTEVDIDHISTNTPLFLFTSPEEQQAGEESLESRNLNINRHRIEKVNRLKRIEKMVAALQFLQDKPYFLNIDEETRISMVRGMYNWMRSQLAGMGSVVFEQKIGEVDAVCKKLLGE